MTNGYRISVFDLKITIKYQFLEILLNNNGMKLFSSSSITEIRLYNRTGTFLLEYRDCFWRYHDLMYTSSMKAQALCWNYGVSVVLYLINGNNLAVFVCVCSRYVFYMFCVICVERELTTWTRRLLCAHLY